MLGLVDLTRRIPHALTRPSPSPAPAAWAATSDHPAYLTQTEGHLEGIRIVGVFEQ